MREPLDVPSVSSALRTAGLPYAGVDFQPALDSTNARAGGLRRPWLVVTTDHQRSGRGRLSRGWEVPDRAAVCVSVLLPVTAVGADARIAGEPGWIPLFTGLAVAEAIGGLTGLDVALKWPNDVLLAADGHRKVCGILCELLSVNEGVVVGTGINVDQTRAELPVEQATSLALCGAHVSREALLTAYLTRLAQRHGEWLAGGEDAARARAAYRAACRTIGAEVIVHRPAGPPATGTAVAVDDDGRLVVESGEAGESGYGSGRSRDTYAAGDVVHVRPGAESG